MDEYFGRTGPHGQRMMRLSAAMQVNLDLGEPVQALRRWRAANLMSPILRAMFANSAAEMDGVFVPGGRSVTWDRADPGRTGVTCLHSAPAEVDPIESYESYALTVPVMMLHDSAGDLVAAPEGLTYESWLEGDRVPPPTAKEQDVHLSTLFPDVRPRGWLEIRTMDVPDERWWGVPLVVLPALLYDDSALAAVLDTLEPLAAHLPELAADAPRTGLRTPDLGVAAERTLDIAIESARRFPRGYFDASMLAAAEEFGERYVRVRRTQADDEGTPRARL